MHENWLENMILSIFSQFSRIKIARADARAQDFLLRIYSPNIVEGSKILNE